MIGFVFNYLYFGIDDLFSLYIKVSYYHCLDVSFYIKSETKLINKVLLFCVDWQTFDLIKWVYFIILLTCFAHNDINWWLKKKIIINYFVTYTAIVNIYLNSTIVGQKCIIWPCSSGHFNNVINYNQLRRCFIFRQWLSSSFVLKVTLTLLNFLNFNYDNNI
jgi:hypothetical protein